MNNQKLRPIAIHLPQYHPIPENDEWWGKGFTEWTNVTKAKPLFKGHYQPHLPADLGYYDLRLAEVREAQAALAKAYGIYGFCYYHYWFNGKKLLERPVEEILASGKPDFPFMLCWANENWTRVWDGKSKHVLQQQHYSPEDDIQHIQYLIPFLKDPRYIKVNGRPMLAIYKPGELPDPASTVRLWREECRKAGLEIYLCMVERHFSSCVEKLEKAGFDASIDFQPFGFGRAPFDQWRRDRHTGFRRVIHFGKRAWYTLMGKEQLKAYMNRAKRIVSYKEYVDFVTKLELPERKVFPCITPGWDNSARKSSDYFIMKDSHPDIYRKWVMNIKNKFQPFSDEENFVFINAWNEWAEGNHLEPCQKWGHKYLEATKDLSS